MSDTRPSVRFSAEIAPARLATVDRNTPFRILLLGDFSGAAHGDNANCVPVGKRQPLKVNAENVPDVMRRFDVTASLPTDVEDQSSRLPLRTLDDFHPDTLLARLPRLEQLMQLRRELLDHNTFDQAAEKVRSWASWDEDREQRGGRGAARDATPPAVPPVIPDNLLDKTLEATQPSGTPPEEAESSAWEAAMRDLVRPYTVPGRPPKQAELVACVERAASLVLDTVLHAPSFQQLESVWSCVRFLLRRLQIGADVKLYLLDLSQAEAAEDICGARDWQQTTLYRVLVEQTLGTAGGEPWAVVGGLYEFAPKRSDAALLAGIAKVAAAAGAAFVADAAPGLVGCPSFVEAPDPRDWQLPMKAEVQEIWHQLRGSWEANYVCLAAPRTLLRLPYGQSTSPIEGFAYEEMSGGPVHEHYLWGHTTAACVQALGEFFLRSGWKLEPNSRLEVEDMPLHVYEHEGEHKVYPPSEVFLTERAVAAMASFGITVLLSVHNRDVVQIRGIRSLAGGRLAGPWSTPT